MPSFFILLRKIKNFEWTEKCQKVFDELNKYLRSPPLFAQPKPRDELQMYIATSNTTVITVLVRKEAR